MTQIIRKTEIVNGKPDFSVQLESDYKSVGKTKITQSLYFSQDNDLIMINSEIYNETYGDGEFGNVHFELSLNELKSLYSNLGLLIQDIQGLQSS